MAGPTVPAGSRDASVTLAWADGRYTFRLAWGELRGVQEDCDAGPLVVLGRLTGGTWRLEDITSVIRWGLVGGGLAQDKALALVETYVEKRPPMENVIFARGILNLGITGPADEEPGKARRHRRAATV